MNQAVPRPIARARLERLIHGLQLRANSSARLLAEHVHSLRSEILQAESHHQSEMLHWESSTKQQRFITVTEWDQHRMQCWDRAEMASYRAVFDTLAQEKTLKEKAKTQLEEVQKEAKARTTEIEKRHSKLVESLDKRLATLQERFAVLARASHSLEHSAQAALAKHSLPTPDGSQTVEPQTFTESTQAIALAEAAIRSAQNHVHRLEHLPLVQFFASPVWWTLCVAVFILSTVMTQTLAQWGWVLSAAVAAAVTGLVILTALLGVRPWLKRASAAEFPRFKGQLQLASHYREKGSGLANAEYDSELKSLVAKRDHRLSEVHQWSDNQGREIKDKIHSVLTTLRARAQEDKLRAASGLDHGLNEVDQQFQLRSQQETEASEKEKATIEKRLLHSRSNLQQQIEQLGRNGLQRLVSTTRRANHFLQLNRQWCQAAFPAWSHFSEQPVDWPAPVDQPRLPLGQVSLDAKILNTSTSPESSTENDEQTIESATLFYTPLIDDYLVIHGDPNLPSIKNLVRSVVLRALTTLPVGKTQVCVIDPPGLGRDFGWLMALGDFDPTLVSHRVWTQTSHIARQLQNLAAGAEDFIQQSLRNQYRNIVDYNRDAGGLSEAYRLLVWNSLPNGLDDQSWKSLQSIMDTGARCGIVPILIVDPAMNWSGPQSEILMRRGVHLHADPSGQLKISSRRLEDWTLAPEVPPTEDQSDSIIQEVGRRAQAASRVEVPLAKMLDFLDQDELSAASNHATTAMENAMAGSWQANSSRFLEIPIGQSGVGRTHSMKLGTGTAQHAIIAGKTGSGKSSLLHALITSALLKYSPRSLRLVLLDFKKGVEFQVYSDAAIPHADIIGIESHREFGLSALQYVDDCLQRRGELFRSGGAQDIASWNAGHPDRMLPRMLIVIDEFQELFVEDDKLSQAASLILDRIVRQGRSFGVHAVLSSQTLAGSYSLPRTTLGQMAVRIALQCDASDAQIIFSDDNPAAARLKHPGQAVYNDAGGRIEGNQPMQIGWLDKRTQVNWFARLPKGYDNQDSTTNRLGRTVIYDGNRPATWDSGNVNLGIQRAGAEINSDAIWCATGESVAISPAVVFPLTNQSGRNMLIVGGEDEMAAAVMDLITHSFVRAALIRQVTPQIVAIQGAKPTDAHALALPDRWKQLPCPALVGDGREAAAILSQVHGWLVERMANEERSSVPVLLNLIQLSRLRSLRREDEFSFSQSDATPDKQLEELLRDGPSHGIYVLIWAESYSTVGRWLPRTALREMEIRMLMQMSTGDSSNLVDTVAAAHLGEHVMLLYDEATSQEQRFRPYAWNSLRSLGHWVREAVTTQGLQGPG
jgi:DNA segregation ATPase FtsK/SpoIIIE, S-DNA-T family